MMRTILNRRRSRTGCSILALATVLAVGPSPAAAQSFQGTGTFTSGSGVITPSGNTTAITVTSPTAVINWIPTDNVANPNVPIVFQPGGTSADFSGGGNYAVLNKIAVADPSRVIQLDGTIRTVASGALNGTGSIYFYSPSGFLLGATSVINVPALVLSALPILQDGNGNFIIGADRTVTFGPAASATASITTMPGSQITANLTGSYVAMVAPRVAHHGTITTNGQAALVAAEAATINFSPDGLFDISVTTGTADANGIALHGDINGQASTGVGDNNRIYAVAVPKNDALTMVIGSGADLGFAIAGAANVDGNAIVLSAGHNVTNGVVDTQATSATSEAAMVINAPRATSAFTAVASGNMHLFANPGQVSTFASNVTLRGDNQAWASASGAGSLLSIAGNLHLSTDEGAGASGGSAEGGETSLYALSGGTVTVAGTALLTANAYGGSTESSGQTGGTGTGGLVIVRANDTGSSLTVTGALTAEANGYGGTSFDGNGGAGFGGATANGGGVSIDTNGGTLALNGGVTASASGFGGEAYQAGTMSGNGTGGNVWLLASGNGDLTLGSFANVYAEGTGGATWDNEANGGTGQGGTINVSATGAGSILSLTGALMSANGIGGGAGEGTCCAAVGGTGTGGLVNVVSAGGGLIQSTGTLEFSAAGQGGWASGIGGNGIGGQNASGNGVFVNAQAGGTISVTGNLELDATGSGGDGDNGGGNGVGGFAQLEASGGTVNATTGEVNVDADGDGGDSDQGGDGGDGTGGRAVVRTTETTSVMNLLDVLIEADGTGGESSNFEGPLGDGGDGSGGRTRIVAQDGLINVAGDLEMDATSTGGAGANGGNAAGVTTPSNDEGAEPAAFLWAGSTDAELRVVGLTDIDVSATGGDGSAGNGGDAQTGGEVDIVSQLGDVNLGNLTVNANATGGDGGLGGAGGHADAGVVDVAWSINGGALTGTISADTVALSLIGQGGAGGDGIDADTGSNGGAGGSGTGGSVVYWGNAAGGTLNVGATTILANGIGGAGGDGGNGGTGTGGNGGAGGAGTGGYVFSGTISSDLNPGSGGDATFTTLSQSANATGGSGGNGGEGGGGSGTGGNGGSAIGGTSLFLIRGVDSTADSISLFANATGGSGGFGSTGGTGGNALTGHLEVEAKDRYGSPDQRGSLTADNIAATAIATGGSGAGGAANGTSTVLGGNSFRVLNGDTDIGSVSFTVSGNLYNGTAGPDYIQVQDGEADVGTFSYNTTGQLAIYTTNTGTLDVAGNLSLSAGNFIDHPTLVGPASPGTIFATSLSITSGGNFFADANLNVTNGIGITVPGSIRFDNATSAAFVDLWAQGGSISLDDISAGGDVSLDAGTTISTGIINGVDIELDAVGNISFVSANAGTELDFDSENGSVTGGNIVAGNQISGSAGGNIILQNLTVSGSPQEGEDFSVGILAIGNISVGNVTAAGPVGFATQGNLLTGTLSAGDLFMALVGGNASTAGITTSGEGAGQVYIGDDSMLLTGGGTWDGDGDFIVSTVLELDPVRTGGSITINGPVNTGRFRAAAGTNLTTGAINSGDAIGLDATGSITTGNLVAGDFVLANAGSITTGSIDADSVEMESTGGNITIGGDVTANGLVELDASGNIVTDNITAGTIELAAGGSITTDNLTTELPLVLAAAAFSGQPQVDPDGVGNIILVAGGNILTGDITAAESILLATPGTITGETIEAGNIFMALAHGDMTFGNATAAEVFLADFAMYSQEGGGGEVGAICIGSCGTLGANGVVTAPPSGSTYTYVTTAGGVALGEQIPVEGDNLSTNGSHYTTSAFSAAAGDELEFWFNYVTSDGGGFADYAWASLLTAGLDPVAILFTARTQASGTIVPGFGLPGVEATLNPSSVPIIDGGPTWSPLGGSSGGCYSAGCGFTGWINSTYEIAEAGNYVVRFGVTNWSDSGFDSGMAFSGITIGGVPVESGLISTGGSITIGNVNAGKMTAAAGTTLTTGIIDVTDFANLVSGGNMVTSAITAGNNLGADAGGTMALGALSSGDIELSSGGNMSFVSANAGTEFDFSSGGSVTGGNVTAGTNITGDAAGTATLNGIWSADSVTLSSNDINIAGSGGIDANGTVTLISNNATQTVIGDGVTSSNYVLSNAEIGRVSGENVVIVGRDTSSFVDMVIGDLTVTGPLAGSTIEGEGGALVFAVGDLDTEMASGVIRVVGDVNATGFGIDNAMEFYADRFELDAATGSISVPGGELGLYADRIHVAQGSILNQLAEDPTYAGYEDDLNEAAATPQPGGVLIADTLWIESDNLQSILIQNTGTFQTRAGFLVRQAFVNEDLDVAGPPGSINLIVNGQILSEGGTLTGVAARDALIDEETDITPFTSNSTINGCPLTGACIIAPEKPPPNPDVIDDQIDLITGDPLGDGDFGNEDSIDDNEEGDEGAENPISPPQPLFDTRPLVPTGDVNDPVSGTGNPALVGGESECEENEDGQCAADQNDGDGQ